MWLQKLNQYLSTHNCKFRPISGHNQVRNLSLKHAEEEVDIFSVYVLNIKCEPEDDLR
jgi:hypothetical protein